MKTMDPHHLETAKIKNLRQYLAVLSLLISLLSTAIIVVFFYVRINHYITLQNQKAAQQTLAQSTNILKRDLDRATGLLDAIQSNEGILSRLAVLENYNLPANERYSVSHELRSYLFKIAQDNHVIEDIIIITPRAQYSASGNSASYALNGRELNQDNDSSYLYTLSTFQENTRLMVGQRERMHGNSNPYLDNKFFFAANIRNSSNETKGVAIILINLDELTKYLLAREQYLIIHDTSGTLYGGAAFHSMNQHAFLGDEPHLKLAGQEYFVNSLYPYQLRMVYQLPTDNQLNLIQIVLLLLVAAVVIYHMAYYFSRRVSNAVIRPIHELLDWMGSQKEVEGGFQLKPVPKPNPFSFREKLMGYFLVTILLPVMLISGLYYFQASRMVMAEMKEIMETEHLSKVGMLNQEMDRLKKVLAVFSSDFDVITAGALKYIDKTSLNDFRTTYLAPGRDESIAIYSNEGELLVSSGKNILPDIEKTDFMREKSDSRFLYNLGANRKGDMRLSIALPIAQHNNHQEQLGLIVVNVNAGYFNNLPLVEGMDEEYILLKGKYQWRINESRFDVLAEAGSLPEENRFQSALTFSDWSYISVLDQSNLQSQIANIFLSNSYLLFILTVIIVAISYLLTKSVVKPFNTLIESSEMGTLHGEEKSNPSFLMEVDEIEQLKDNFSKGLVKLNELADEKQRIQEEYLLETFKKREIQLFAIQNQVNPHFLYNALENLLYLVEAEETDRALVMISSLSRFFHFVTNRREMMIPLEREMEFTYNYLRIMRERFQNFKVICDVDDSLRHVCMLKLMLQPLVENVIHHGVSHTEDLVHIWISIQQEGEYLTLEVRDDARGITPERLEQIQQDLQASSYNRSGLYNVYDRLELYYREQFTFTITSQLNKGTSVKIRIPMKTDSKDALLEM